MKRIGKKTMVERGKVEAEAKVAVEGKIEVFLSEGCEVSLFEGCEVRSWEHVRRFLSLGPLRQQSVGRDKWDKEGFASMVAKSG